MGFLDLFDEVDYVCDQIAEAFVILAIEVMLSMCANAGQFTIVVETLDDYVDQIQDISDGEFDEVWSPHPEATQEINDEGNDICQAGADLCQEIRDIAEELAAEEGDLE